MKPKIIKKKSVIIELVNYDNNTCTVVIKKSEFNVFELIGILENAKMELMKVKQKKL